MKAFFLGGGGEHCICHATVGVIGCELFTCTRVTLIMVFASISLCNLVSGLGYYRYTLVCASSKQGLEIRVLFASSHLFRVLLIACLA